MGDPRVARWACLTRFTVTDLADLHRVEKSFVAKQQKQESESKVSSFRIGELAGIAKLRELNDKYGQFWSHRTTEDHKVAEMRRFESAIYKIWGPLERKWIGGKMSEMEFMHTADSKIFELGFQFRKFSEGSGSTIAKKWAAGEKKVGIENAVKDD